jgi:LysM repeat protein
MENEEFNLEEELREVREKREAQERQRSEELYNYLQQLRVKRIIKNGIAVGLAGVLLTCGYLALSHKKKPTTPTNVPTITELDDNITLTRNYTVEFGDTLSGIATTTGIDMDDIQSDNNILNPNMIDMGQRLVLNYSVDPEDLDLYTQTILVNGQDIGEIVYDYETNIQTLIELNPGVIVSNNDGTYTITSSTITVPNFITASEYRSQRQAQR